MVPAGSACTKGGINAISGRCLNDVSEAGDNEFQFRAQIHKVEPTQRGSNLFCCHSHSSHGQCLGVHSNPRTAASIKELRHHLTSVPPTSPVNAQLSTTRTFGGNDVPRSTMSSPSDTADSILLAKQEDHVDKMIVKSTMSFRLWKICASRESLKVVFIQNRKFRLNRCKVANSSTRRLEPGKQSS